MYHFNLNQFYQNLQDIKHVRIPNHKYGIFKFTNLLA